LFCLDFLLVAISNESSAANHKKREFTIYSFISI